MTKIDTILKEFSNNVAEIIIKSLCNIQFDKLTPLQLELPITEERRVDFLAKTVMQDKEQFIHLEYQIKQRTIQK